MSDQLDLEGVSYYVLRVHAEIRVVLDRLKVEGATGENLIRLDELLVRQEISLYLLNDATRNGFSRKPKT